MKLFNERLKEERHRVGLSQEKFAELGGAKRTAQVTYEKGERMPDATYLEGLQQAGVDTNYLITGERLYDPELKALQGTARYAAIFLRIRDLEEKLGTKFNKQEMLNLGGYVNQYCSTREAMEEFVHLAQAFSNQAHEANQK